MRGYDAAMPGDDGLSPDAAPTDAGHDHHTRIEDKKRFRGETELDGVPPEEGVGGADVEEALEDDPDRVSINRRDVPDTPENSIEARTEGD